MKRRLEEIKPRDIVLVDGEPFVILGHKKGGSKDVYYGFELGKFQPNGLRTFNVTVLIYANTLELIGTYSGEFPEIDDPYEVKPGLA